MLDGTTTCDILVIDELGPLELGRGDGFTSAFGLLEARRFRLAVIVVRPALVAAAHSRWPGAAPLWELSGDVAANDGSESRGR